MTDDYSNSPIAEPTIGELFSAHPDQITDIQFDRIIDVYRGERQAWNVKEKVTRAAKGAPKVPKGSISGLSLEDLGL